jgi:hypothetical protein
MPQTHSPTVRAAHLLEDLRSLAALGAIDAPRVLAQLTPATIKTIEAASTTARLPLALNLEMAEAVYRVAGEAGSRRWGTASLLASLDGFFKPLFLGLTKLMAPSPSLMFKTIPQGWSTAYQGCGSITVTQPAPGQTRLTCSPLPPALLTPAFLFAVCGTLAAAFEVSPYTGTVALEPWKPGGDEVSWLVTWKKKG